MCALMGVLLFAIGQIALANQCIRHTRSSMILEAGGGGFMNRKRIALAVVLGCLIGPSLGQASSVYYTADGSVMDKQGSMLPIVGEMYIDDQLRDWEGNKPGQPTELHDEVGLFEYQYYITGYSLKVGEYTVCRRQWHVLHDPVQVSDLGGLELRRSHVVLGGRERTIRMDRIGLAGHFTFYNADQTLQHPSQYWQARPIL